MQYYVVPIPNIFCELRLAVCDDIVTTGCWCITIANCFFFFFYHSFPK